MCNSLVGAGAGGSGRQYIVYLIPRIIVDAATGARH